MATLTCTSSQSSIDSSGLPSPPRSPTDPPEFPYSVGAKFVVRKHVPPTTLEMGYWKNRGRYVKPKVAGNPTQLELCLAHPPISGITYAEEFRCIEIADIIRGGKDCGAQTVLTTDGFVAKIYDPLFYDYGGNHWRPSQAYVTGEADRHYITEVAAYSEFQGSSIQGGIMPAYHGSWTMDISVLFEGHRQIRQVRLILIEYIPGASMCNVNPKNLTWPEREAIMIKFIEAETDLSFMGLHHGDFEQRNIILSLPEGTDTYDGDDLRLCVIDYAISDLLKDSGRALAPEFHNPLFYWPGQTRWSDWGWLPAQEEATDWMWEIWGGGGKDGKYLAVERDPDSPYGDPKDQSNV